MKTILLNLILLLLTTPIYGADAYFTELGSLTHHTSEYYGDWDTITVNFYYATSPGTFLKIECKDTDGDWEEAGWAATYTLTGTGEIEHVFDVGGFFTNIGHKDWYDIRIVIWENGQWVEYDDTGAYHD